LKNKQLEEIINEWSSELEEHVRSFTKEAIKVSKWDKEMIENGEQVGNILSLLIQM
jgi:nuclear pore complex protein Nup62